MYGDILRVNKRTLCCLSIHTCLTFLLLFTASVFAQTPVTYYVDCTGGNDAYDGLTPASAWQSVEKANNALLKPGDALLFRRGCTWTNTNNGVYLNAKWQGADGNPITIGAYGTGDNPVLRADAAGSSQNQVNVLISGSYLLVENLKTTLINPYRDQTCPQADGSGVPKGWYVGVQITGSHNDLRNLEASALAVGVSTNDNTAHNRILSSYLHDLNALWRIDFRNGVMGAIGVLLHGDDNEVAYNLIERNYAGCEVKVSNPILANYSAPFEVYNANRNYIHHNKAYEHRKQIEMGHDSGHTTDDNVLAYNLFVSSRPSAKGPNLHTVGNPFGPVNRTQAYNNTIVLTGPDSEAIIASGGGTFRNNILVAELKAAYYGANTVESNNLYWDPKNSADTLPDPCVQSAGGGCSPLTAINVNDPLFINAGMPSGDYRLQPNSPAKNKGVIITTNDTKLQSILAVDLDGNPIPPGTAPTIGAYEIAP